MVTLFGGGQRDSIYFLILYFIFYIIMGVPGIVGGFGGVPGGFWGSGFYRHAYLFRIPKKVHVLESQYSWQLICPKIRDLCSPIYIFFFCFFFLLGGVGMQQFISFFVEVYEYFGNVWGGGIKFFGIFSNTLQPP